MTQDSNGSCASPDNLDFSNADLDKLAVMLIKRVNSPAGFHLFEFILGVVVALGLIYLVYRRRIERLRHRHKESDAVELLKNMDDDSIKRILGDSHLPSWINFPDFERVGWINEILAQLWPSINAAISQRFREMLAPLLRDNKPSWISSLKLFRFDLGDVAPYANGVKIYHQDIDSRDQILMEVDFSWIGEQDIQLDIKPIPKHLGPLSPAGKLLSSIVRLRAGIERITVNGRARIIWRPLLDELPCIGGMQVALVGMPTFSFDVTMYGGDVSIVPGLEAWLTQFLKETVFRPYILPERFVLPFTEEAAEEEIRPVAILLVTVKEAKNVPKMDLFSASDPYIKMFVRSSTQMRTTTKQNNANPVWNENFRLLVHDIEHQEVQMILMDYDDMNPDDVIGRCVLPLRDMECSATKEYWLDLDMDSDIPGVSDSQSKNAGFIDTIIAAEQKVADQGDKLWKKMPGVKKGGDQKCQVCVEATLYKLDSEDVEGLLKKHPHPNHESGLTHHESNKEGGDEHHKPSVQYEDGEGSESETSQSAKPSHHPHQDLPKKANGHAPSSAHDDHDSLARDSDKEDSREARFEAADSDEEDDYVKRTRQEEEEKERNRTKVEGKTIKKMDDGELKSRARDALQGGILEIKPKKAADLVRKPWYKASFLKSAAQLEVSVCGQFKRTASVPGSQPVFNDSVEFVLGGEDIDDSSNKVIKIEVWDHKLHLNHFRGGCTLDLKHILQAKRVSKSMKLSGVRRGELAVDVVWVPAHASAAAHKHGH